MVRGRDRVDLRLGDGVPHAQPGVALGVLHHQARRIPRHRPHQPHRTFFPRIGRLLTKLRIVALLLEVWNPLM